MNYSVLTTPNFDKEFKRLVKKYPSLKKEILQLAENLSLNPDIGTPLGSNVYKIRIAIASKGKGKRSGARVMTFLKVENETITLFSIYSKGEKNDISDDEINDLLNEIDL